MVLQRHRLFQEIRRYKRTPYKGSPCRGGGRLPRGVVSDFGTDKLFNYLLIYYIA